MLEQPKILSENKRLYQGHIVELMIMTFDADANNRDIQLKTLVSMTSRKSWHYYFNTLINQYCRLTTPILYIMLSQKAIKWFQYLVFPHNVCHVSVPFIFDENAINILFPHCVFRRFWRNCHEYSFSRRYNLWMKNR